MASTSARFEFSGFLPVGATKNPRAASVDNEEAFHHRIANACQLISNFERNLINIFFQV
jgi:hypothetical protein